MIFNYKGLIAATFLSAMTNAHACGEISLSDFCKLPTEEYVKLQWIKGLFNTSPEKLDNNKKTACIIGVLNPAVDSKTIEEARKIAYAKGSLDLSSFCSQIEKYSSSHQDQPLKILSIKNNDSFYPDETTQTLIKVIEKYDELEVVDLAGNLECNEQFELLIPAIAKLKNIKTLDLGYNSFEVQGLKLLAEMAKNKKSLKKLIIDTYSVELTEEMDKIIEDLKKSRPDLEVIS